LSSAESHTNISPSEFPQAKTQGESSQKAPENSPPDYGFTLETNFGVLFFN